MKPLPDGSVELPEKGGTINDAVGADVVPLLEGVGTPEDGVPVDNMVVVFATDVELRDTGGTEDDIGVVLELLEMAGTDIEAVKDDRVVIILLLSDEVTEAVVLEFEDAGGTTTDTVRTTTVVLGCAGPELIPVPGSVMFGLKLGVALGRLKLPFLSPVTVGPRDVVDPVELRLVVGLGRLKLPFLSSVKVGPRDVELPPVELLLVLGVTDGKLKLPFRSSVTVGPCEVVLEVVALRLVLDADVGRLKLPLRSSVTVGPREIESAPLELPLALGVSEGRLKLPFLSSVVVGPRVVELLVELPPTLDVATGGL